MIVGVTAPIHVKSENELRRLTFVSPHALPAYTAKTRLDVSRVLTQLPRPPATLESGERNRYVVTLTRISVGYLDDDNLRGSFKGVRDAVAEWLGIDDGHERIRFAYRQEGAKRGTSGIRIEVRDESPGETVRRELGEIHRTFEKRPRGDEPRAKKPEPAALAQQALVFRAIWAALPWEQNGGRPVLSKLSMRAIDPPRFITIRVPTRALSGGPHAPGTAVVFERDFDRVRGQEAVIYRPTNRPTKGNGP